VSADTIAARRALVAERFPAVAKAFAQGASAQFEPVLEGGIPIDLRMGERQLYGGDARRFSAEQVAAFAQKPLRLFMNRIDNAGLVSPICIRLVGALNERLLAAGETDLSTHPSGSPNFLIVFGLGLGHHLAPLVEQAQARWLILVEPMLGVFEHSLAAVDWAGLIEGFERRGGGVHIVTASDPSEIAAAIVRTMDAHGIAFADGSSIFTHYPHWAFAEARKRLHEAIEFAFVNRGFFEDELRMITNAAANFAGCSFRLFEARPRLARPETAVIAGAGPSLDESLETVRRIRPRVVLFSCGTALRPLLKNGLMPDFHCELENVPEVHGVIEEAARFGDLRKITLVASATVDPRVPPFFGSTLFFFRDRVCSTDILGRDFHMLPGAAPTCVNVGLAAAVQMGLTKFAFAGTDCGTRPGGKRHAEGTIYRDLGVWQERDRSRGNAIEVEGNFGGVIETDWVYDACRLMMVHVISRHRIDVVNMSDGALIPGARPCAPEAFDVAGPDVDIAAFRRAIEAPLRRFGPGEIFAGRDFGRLGQELERLFGDLDRLLAEAAGEADFAALYGKLRQFAKPSADQYGGAMSIVSGTLTALPRIAMFYGYRVPDGALRRLVFDCCLKEIRAICGVMAEESCRLLAETARQARSERIAGEA
jgi:hypothetical protein